MGADFPVPRGQLPRVEVSPLERQARKTQMERMLRDALDEFDRFRTLEQSRVDPARWKLLDSQDMLRLFREREPGSSGAKTLSSSTATTSVASFSMSDDDSNLGQWDDAPYEASSAAALADGRDKHKALRMVGDLPGRVENAVYAYITKTTHELALVQTFLYDDVADCTILNELEGPTQENPLQFLGYKWVVKKTAGGGRLGKLRDLVYVESCGMTTTRAGDQIGYVLLESVDLPGFPEMKNRNCVRAVQSVSILLRQKSDMMVEVFATGLADPTGGKMMRPLMAQLAGQTMLTLTKSMELAECKRLTKMLVSQRRAREEVLYNLKHKPTACSLCHQKRKFYNGVSLVDCSICGHVICTRCQTHKRVFIADGALGRFHRVGCCKTCVLAADRTRQAASREPIKLSISAQLQRQNSSREFDSMESHSFSRPRSSSESSIGDMNEITVKPSLQPTLEEEPMPSEASQRGRGLSSDLASSNRQPGITLLPSSSAPQDRSLVRAANVSRRNVQPSSAMVPAMRQPEPQAVLRGRSGSSATGRYLLTQGPEAAPQAIRPSPSPPTFTSSAPAGSYDLRGQMVAAGRYGAMPSMPQTSRQQATSGASSQQDLYARMMELRRLAESTYQTTQQNERIMQQQRTPSHAAARPGSRF